MELRGRRPKPDRIRSTIMGLRRVLAPTFQAGEMPLFIPWRRRAPRRPTITGNKATATQSTSLRLCLCRVPFQKDGYASAIGLCKDSIIIQSTKPSNSDFWRSFSM